MPTLVATDAVPNDILKAMHDLAEYARTLSSQIQSDKANQDLEAGSEDAIIRDKIYAIQDLLRELTGLSDPLSITTRLKKDGVEIRRVPRRFSQWNLNSDLPPLAILKRYLDHFNDKKIANMSQTRGWFSQKFNLDSTTVRKFKTLEAAVIKNASKMPVVVRGQEDEQTIPVEVLDKIEKLAKYAVALSGQIQSNQSLECLSKEDKLIAEKIESIKSFLDAVVGPNTLLMINSFNGNYQHNIAISPIQDNFQEWTLNSPDKIMIKLAAFMQSSEWKKISKPRSWFFDTFGLTTKTQGLFHDLKKSLEKYSSVVIPEEQERFCNSVK